ncbi:insulin-like growth factor-binding protein complex acid labile subunit [Chrysoperla carnea]|uniref:insulin-like growth factor-binding protein complex acid labile subunit n=1 Tax=Chrysoperla carnea TaxID=189513 RepID=UPI001D095482|nr:insulin-like growth factor-binding protein complex acid labile subunit [Chrysoperla carnea]
MPSLIYLDLSDNKLKSLPAKMFENNPQLRILNISNNEISSILKDTFIRMPDLIELNLAHNNLTVIKNIFTSLTQLQELNLSWNRIYKIEPQTFKENANLKKIINNFNPISDLEENTFLPYEWGVTNKFLIGADKTATITELHIGNCLLSTLKDHYFVHLRRLKFLNLETNQITDFERNVFRENTRLEYLRLSYNELRELPSNVFDRLRNLKTLWLKANFLTELPIDVFKRNTKLEILQLGYNKIVPKNIFEFVVELKELSLYRNQITYLEPGIFDNLIRLKKLSLHRNQLKEIEPNIFFNLIELNSLILDTNPLTKIKIGTFSSFHDGYADESSRILEISMQAVKLTELSPDAFAPLSRLISLDVGYNYIDKIDTDFFKFMGETLTVLILSGNRLAELPSNIFDSLENVIRLDLNRNRLTKLDPEIFQNMVSLEKLDLANNKFKIIPTNLFNVPRLIEVNLAENELTYLASDIFEGEDCIVERFYIQENKLTYLESDFFKRSKLKYLRFGRNPWQCGCLNEIMNDIYRLNIEYPLRENFDGTNPSCVVTDNNTCVRESYLSEDLYKQFFSIQHSNLIW